MKQNDEQKSHWPNQGHDAIENRQIKAEFLTPQAFRLLIFAIFALAIIIRFIHIDFNAPAVSDGATYDYAAKNLLKYKTLTYDHYGEIYNGTASANPTIALTPGYPLFLASIYFIFGENLIFPRIANLLFSLLTMIYVYKIGIQMNFNRLAQLALIFTMAFYPGFIYNLTNILTEQMFLFLFIAYAYYFIKCLNHGKKRDCILSSIFLAVSLFVRSVSLPFVAVSLFFILFSKLDSRKKRVYVQIFLLTLLVFFVPWWIRNFVTFGRFIFLTAAGDNPRMWGAAPYFLGLGNWPGQTASEVANDFFRLYPIGYVIWRSFGFILYMWGDVWDELLTHNTLYPLTLLHYIMVTLGFVSIIYFAVKKDFLKSFLGSVPLFLTVFHFLFHGLPRYVWPSMPFLIILLVSAIQSIFDDKPSGEANDPGKFLKWLYFPPYIAVASVLAIAIPLSIFLFPLDLDNQISESRIRKYTGSTVEEVENFDKSFSIQYSMEEIHELGISSTTSIRTRENKIIYKNSQEYSILTIPVEYVENGDDNIISKVSIKTRNNRIFSKLTVYWNNKDVTGYNDLYCYSVQTLPYKKQYTFYIEGDINQLRIVPSTFRNASFEVNEIEITKFFQNRDS